MGGAGGGGGGASKVRHRLRLKIFMHRSAVWGQSKSAYMQLTGFQEASGF